MKILIGGLRASGSGYPNAERTIALLQRLAGVEVIDCGRALPESLHLWRIRQTPAWVAGVRLLRLFFGNAASVIRVLSWSGGPKVVYVPYPSIFFLWQASWIPRRLRPSFIADAYISVWDSSIKDRQSGFSGGFFARFLKGVERRALKAAALVLVDTEAHREYYAVEFGIDRSRIQAVPLAIDEENFVGLPPARGASPLRVLFVGTLIPLHGVSVILGAIRELLADEGLRFTILGNGQLGHQVEAFAEEVRAERFEWIRQWCPADEVARHVAEADLCLGVFGGYEKTARVLPLKVYMYLAAGRPVITQSEMSLPRDAPPLPVVAVAPLDSAGLASSIRRLAANPEARASLGESGRAYYLRWLSNEQVARTWRGILANWK